MDGDGAISFDEMVKVVKMVYKMTGQTPIPRGGTGDDVCL